MAQFEKKKTKTPKQFTNVTLIKNLTHAVLAVGLNEHCGYCFTPGRTVF